MREKPDLNGSSNKPPRGAIVAVSILCFDCVLGYSTSHPQTTVSALGNNTIKWVEV